MGCSARGYAATWGSLRPGTDAVEVHCANVQGCTIFSCVVRGSQKSCTAQTLVTLSVLVRSVLSINHRLTLEDASYEPAGPRHGAGLLFFGVRGGAEPRRADAETEQQGSGAMATQSLYQVMQVCSSKSFDNPVCFA